MNYVLMTIGAMILMGLIASAWYSIKAILTIKGDAAVVIRELESIHTMIANNTAEIERHQRSIDISRDYCITLRSDLSKTRSIVDKCCIDSSNTSSQLNALSQSLTLIHQQILKTDLKVDSEARRLDENIEEVSRTGNEYTNHSIADLRSYIDKRIDKSSNKILHIDETALVNSIQELVASLGKTK